MLSFEFSLRLSAILKLDFLKSPGKSGSARLPRGMKLGNDVILWWVLEFNVRALNESERVFFSRASLFVTSY